VARVFEDLPRKWPGCDWLAALARNAEQRLNDHSHGDLPRWREALESLPRVVQSAGLDLPAPEFGSDANNAEGLREVLMALHPWRKGPLVLGGQSIDAEWRSDWKWNRVAPHVDLAGQRILDIGCGNGYFGWRMLGAGADLVIGIDPTLLFVMQYLACRHFGGDLPNYVLPLGIQDLPRIPVQLDTVFSMGVLYHRRDPLHHLRRIHALLRKKGGTLVLETLVLPGPMKDDLLVPEGRYARMRNVWALPGTDRLLDWVGQAGFRTAEVVDETPTTTSEQRSTDWMRFESLDQALDPGNPGLTVEGLPAPIRAIVIAQT
jgi:tRNA (mo5U34)-methyltransferase